ncbi:Hypothetical predicted protein [Xyrichtys novacula]|uniref:Secreted protein n=1 Tax=Xyrichtys novacula TaxID=13765 RepID=A0AAV1FGA9_XYRNO|nr:Hypothetical predicted protein [Xyrichtys novacula]
MAEWFLVLDLVLPASVLLQAAAVELPRVTTLFPHVGDEGEREGEKASSRERERASSREKESGQPRGRERPAAMRTALVAPCHTFPLI